MSRWFCVHGVKINFMKNSVPCMRPIDQLHMYQHIVECRYNEVQHNMILHMVRQWLRQNMYQRLYSQKTPHILPSQVRYGVSFMRIRVKIDCVITAPHCVLSFYQEPVVVVQGLRKAFVTETKKRCCNKKEDAGIKVAVKNNNIMVMPGEVFGLLGPNGAGKTTTLNMVIAEEGPTAGKVGWFAEERKFKFKFFIVSTATHLEGRAIFDKKESVCLLYFCFSFWLSKLKKLYMYIFISVMIYMVRYLVSLQKLNLSTSQKP